jgi:hypothetical protein
MTLSIKTKTCGIAATALAAVSLLPVGAAQAGGTITFGEDKSVSLGLGIRSSFSSVENGAPNGSRSENISLDSFRVYMGGSLNKYIKGTFNFDKSGDTLTVLDGYAQFEFADEFNVWIGRMLPPGDRANMDGPYYLNTWTYPGVVSNYPAKFAGRDDGVTVWGKALDKKLVYAGGVFMGHNRAPGLSNQSGSVLFAGRVAYNILDPEPNPAYYESSTYYGSVDVLTVAFVFQHQKNGAGTALLAGDFTGWSADVLFEKKFPIGVITLEGAYYDFDTDGVRDFNGLITGEGYLAGAAYMFPEKVGWGYIQPFARYQYFDSSLLGPSSNQYDVGAHYVIDGHNARISLSYTSAKGGGALTASDQFIVGVQLQF